MSKTFLLMLLVLVSALSYLPAPAITDTINCTPKSSPPPLNAISQLDTNESLSILVLFSDSSSTIQATILFFHTADDQFFFFWMLGDPFSQAQNWQTGTKNEHFQIDGDLLTLIFIEFQSISDPNINTTVLAKITSDFTVSATENDFRPILNQFISHLSPTYEIITTEGCIEVLQITQIGSSISILLDYNWSPIIIQPTTSEGTSGSLTIATSETEQTTTKQEPSQGLTGLPLYTSGFIILSSISFSVLIMKKFRQKR